MGCDGGSIPKRIELVRVKQPKEKKDIQQVLLQTWFYCQLSKTPLKSPVCADLLGRLYNLSAVLEALLRKNKEVPHITSRKDVVILNLTEAKNNTDPLLLKLVCPITQKEMNGFVKFVYLSCGCVLSQEALKSVVSDKCLVCNKEYVKNSAILINPSTDSEIEESKQRLLIKSEQKALLKLTKKQKNLKNEIEPSRKKLKIDKLVPSINLPMPNLSEIDANIKNSSKAIQSLYFKKDKDGKAIGNKNNWLATGTFNRYSAC
jgi:hypothetical protein